MKWLWRWVIGPIGMIVSIIVFALGILSAIQIVGQWCIEHILF